MNSKMTTSSHLSTTEPKEKQKEKQTSKQVEQEHDHRNGAHREGYQWGGAGGRMGEEVQEKRRINGGYKTESRRLRIV